MIEIYYNNKIKSYIIGKIKKARERIYILHFWFTYKEIIDLVIEKHKSGIEVLIVIDHRTYTNKLESYSKKYDISALEYFWKNGIDAKVFNGKMMHHKTIIIDNNILFMRIKS